MSLRALQEYTYYSRYAGYLEDKNRRESWTEAVDAMMDMHLKRYPEVKEDIEWVRPLVKEKRVLGSQRALQFKGTPIEKKNMRLYNCTASYCDRIRFFQEAFWVLLCGAGVGYSIQKHHIAKLPKFTKKVSKKIETFVIPDSIEGWADALGILLATYFFHPDFPKWEGKKVKFDFSAIRLKGSKLGSGVGKAPGAEPLKNALEKIMKLLSICKKRGTVLRPIDAHDIIMHTADAVLSGGVRRSSCIALFSKDDEDMLKSKVGNWRHENPQRGRANNSVVLMRNEITKAEFKNIIENVKEFGEPGFIFVEDLEALFNPCVTADTIIATDTGLKVVQDLLNVKFNALVEGKLETSTENGFWYTGQKSVFELKFKSGRSLKLTPNHKILTVSGWKEAKDIDVDDEAIINNHRNYHPIIDAESPDYAKGYCLGNFLSDGNKSKKAAQMKWWGKNKEEYREDGYDLLEQAGWLNKHHKIGYKPNHDKEEIIESRALLNFAKEKACFDGENKNITTSTITGTWSYLSGLIAGYFDGDGTVSVNFKKGCSLRIGSSQIENLCHLQIALNAFGIFSKIYKNRKETGFYPLPDGHGSNKEYFCEAMHELVISCDNILNFLKYIKIRNKEKSKKIHQIVDGYQRTPNRTHFIDILEEKEELAPQAVFDCSVPSVNAFDANSIYVHNCSEIGLYAYDENGNTGWAVCNLCEINGKKVKCKEDFALACRAAAILGTLQAGYTKFDYLGKVTENIVKKEALLGVSITGMMDNPDVLFHLETQQEMAKIILKINAWMAKKIGINAAARATAIKPAGTTSCILGTSSGIHPHHAKRYFRRVQSNNMETVLKHFKKYNSQAVEKSVWDANNTDEVITFCIEVPDGAKTKNQVKAIELLEHVRLTQQNWIRSGKRKELCVQPWLNHNVSNTCSVLPDEWGEVTDYIYKNRKWFAGISLLPQSGDLDYPQAPMCHVHLPSEILSMYGDGALMASGLIVDGLHAFENNLWKACDAVLGFGDPLKEPKQPRNGEYEHWKDKIDWIRRVEQFAERYCDNDLRKCAYLLKEVNNWKLWVDLQRENKEVPYDKLIEKENGTKLLETLACASGQCEAFV